MKTTVAATSRLRRSGLKRSLSGATAAACMGGALQTANAKIIYSGLQNRSTNATFAYVDDFNFAEDVEAVNLDGSGPNEFLLKSHPGKGDPWHELHTFFPNSIGTIRVDSFYDIRNLDAGDPIGADSTFDSEFYAMFMEYSPEVEQYIPWTQGYFGYRFNPTGSQDLYGWGQMSFSADGQEMTLVDWAYEDTGAPILAGQIPEPASLFLAAGLTLAALFRRRSTTGTGLADS